MGFDVSEMLFENVDGRTADICLPVLYAHACHFGSGETITLNDTRNKL